MVTNGRPRTLTFKALAEDECRVDQIRGRRYCPVHRRQQMIPLLPGMDVCPACRPAGNDHSQPLKPMNDQTD
jgi:hypothetical protein